VDQVVSPERLLDGRLKLRHLVLATTIADAGSLARAAEQLRITQPVVTRGLQDLESVLGVPLFERSAQGVVPTVYGTAFIEHARGVISQIRQAGRTLGDLAAADAGTVTVGTHLAGSNVLLPLAIARLKAAHPGVTVVVRESTPDRLQSQLLVGDVDLTVGRLTPADPRIEQVRLYVEPIVLVVRADHPVLAGRVPTFSALAALPWIVPVAATQSPSRMRRLRVSALVHSTRSAGQGSPCAVKSCSISRRSAVPATGTIHGSAARAAKVGTRPASTGWSARTTSTIGST